MITPEQTKIKNFREKKEVIKDRAHQIANDCSFKPVGEPALLTYLYLFHELSLHHNAIKWRISMKQKVLIT